MLVENADALGVAFSGASIIGTFADYDRDGDLDLFVVPNRLPVAASLLNAPFSLSRGPRRSVSTRISSPFPANRGTRKSTPASTIIFTATTGRANRSGR